jgi:glycine dehydrogenase subunit 2
VKAFYGNFLIVVRALTYITTLGAEGIPAACRNAVLNANYLLHRLRGQFKAVGPERCMHEFELSLEREAKEKHVTAMDIAKALIDEGMPPPTMYFPLIVKEALMM